MTNPLAKKKCVPCLGGEPPMNRDKIAHLHRELIEGWEVIKEHQLEKTFRFKNFRQALDFTVKVGELAESEGHHPDIHLAWGKVRLVIWTHKVDGLTESDFILAAKCDAIEGDFS